MGRLGSLFLFGFAACTTSVPRTIPRVVDGRVEHGPFVSPYAYEWFIKGEVAASTGRHEQAAMAFETATAAPSEDVWLLARLAEEYEWSDASRRADRTLTSANRDYPASARLALAEGRIARSRGLLAEALSSFTRASRLAPAWDEPVIAMAETLFSAGHVHRAKAILVEHIGSALDGYAEDTRSALIDMARRTGDAETLELALSLDPSSTSTARAQEAGELALKVGQPALAARILSKALNTPENVALWLRALVQSGDRERAAAFMANADRELLGGVARQADFLVEIDEVDLALQLLEKAERSPRAVSSTGNALLARGDYVRAALALASVPKGAASYEAARLALAACATSLGRQGAAAETLSMTPHESLAVRMKLAEIYADEGDLRAGLRLFDPTQPAERGALATLFERAGRFDDAAAYYASADLASSDVPRLRARASAELLVSWGDRPGAVAILESWTASTPNDLYARVRLVELLRADDRIEAALEKALETFEVSDEPRLRARLNEVLVTLQPTAQ
ncbi:MAG: hypothetical protein WBM46_04385 [Polyangiales bacterium]